MLGSRGSVAGSAPSAVAAAVVSPRCAGSRASRRSTRVTASGGAVGAAAARDGAGSCARRSPVASRSSPSKGSRPESSRKRMQPSA